MEQFLLFVSESVYSCRFGTFLFDCEKERKEADVYRKTCSLWSFTNCNLKFLNPRYKQAMVISFPSFFLFFFLMFSPFNHIFAYYILLG